MVPYLEMGGSNGFLFGNRSEEHTSELQSHVRISYAVFCLKKKKKKQQQKQQQQKKQKKKTQHKHSTD